MECKELMKMRKMRSTERLVKNLAAETITKGLRRYHTNNNCRYVESSLKYAPLLFYRSLSRSRSRIQSETSSFHHSEVQSLASRSVAEAPKQRPMEINAGSRVLQISDLLVESVFGVVWQGKNNLYCTLRFMDWEHKTLTVPEAADAASWLDETIYLPIHNDGHDHTKPLGSLVVSILHENLVVTDKLIAQVDIPLISIFEGDVSSPQYTCETFVAVEQTAFDGTKFKRKAKGVVKFSARIIHGNFTPANSRTKHVDTVAPPRPKDNLEVRLDSISGSLITHSIDPDNMREDSLYDFSSTQLRDAVNLLQEWEAPPAGPATAAAKASAGVTGKSASNATSRPASQPPSRSISRPSSAKNVLHPNAATFFADPGVQKATRDNTTKPPTPTAASSSQKSMATTNQVPSVTAAPAPPAPRRSIRTESRGLAGTELTGGTPNAGRDPLSHTAPAALRPVSANVTATSANSKTATRLRDRRSSADDSAVRRNSIESGVSKKLKPATDVQPVKSGASVAGATRALRFRYGEHVVDEAFRLSMKAKGAFLKLKISELANLLHFLNFPVNAELLDGFAPISNLKQEDVLSSVAAAMKRSRNEANGEAVSIPIVHSMSLAATISFLARDHNLLANSTRGGSVDGNNDPTGAPVGVMNEERSERVLAQLVGLVEGSYPDAKMFVLKACASERAPAKVPSTGNSSVASEPCRPALWSASAVRDFLRTICVTHAPDLELTGQQLLALDGNALRNHFSDNPSIDRTRLSVYLQTLQYLDTWWDRGIRPGEIYHKESLDSEDPSVKSGNSGKRNKSKRRGSKAGYDPVSAKWGDLSLVLESLKDGEFSGAGPLRSKVVDGGRAIQSHLLKIADFQVLLEALNPLNRAFGWGCSLESLVRFASIVGGMRGHLWVQDDSLTRTVGSNNSSFADLSQLSGGLDEAKASAQDEIGRWVVLQKGSASSTSELTQLVRLCQELRVVMKYTSREDDFIAFIPLPCLRITSVQEVRAGAFQAALEGLLLDDISVGKKVVVAGIDALVRTCERFEWWDRPSAQVMESMSNQVGEVVSLVEAQSKRRVGVRLYGSGICDALPLEALRLCTDDEYNHAIESIEAKKNVSREVSDAEGVAPATKPARRKSRANVNGDSRKTRLRTLIRTLNVQDDEPVSASDRRARATTPPVAPPAKTFTSRLSSRERMFEESSNKSELSNLSGDELTPPPMRASPSKKKKTGPVSPQKKLTKRIMVRNDPLALSKSNDPAEEDNEAVRVIGPNYARSAATSAVVKTRTESPTDQSLWSEVEPPVIDYSWLKNVPRSPIDFTQEVPAVGDQNLPDSPPALAPADTKKHTPERKQTSSAPLHIIQAGFDADRAEYTTGVPKIRLDDSGDEVEAARNNRYQPKHLRGNRPQSAPSTGGKNKKNVDGKAASKEQPSPMQSAEARTSFGLAGMGYVGNGQLKQHPNQWVNEDILPIPEAEVPRVIPNKTAIHHTDFRSGTNKLFEFNKRNAAEVEQAGSGNHFGNAGEAMSAQNEALSPPRRTTAVPARPRSANPAGRGVTNPLKSGIKQTLAEALGGEFVFPGEDATAGGDAGKVAAKSPVKRTREEELRHIAAAKSAKEMSLKEKVLMKELKRLQKNEK